jgi:hypothetical protein
MKRSAAIPIGMPLRTNIAYTAKPFFPIPSATQLLQAFIIHCLEQ